MMTYETFKEVVKESFLDFMPEEFTELEVVVIPVTKVNVTLDGLTIRNRNSDIAPTIYINDMYERYLGTGNFKETLLEACKDIEEAYDSIPSVNVNADDIFENVDDKVVFQLINTEQNKLFLAKSPHRTFQDLSIVYRIVVDCVPGGIASAMVTNELAEKLGKNEEQLYALAVKNTKRILPPSVRSMCDVMKEMFSEELVGAIADEFDGYEMWVISNHKGINGASTLLYEEVLHELAEKLKSDLYILPSSVHEVIAVSADTGTPEELAEMVASINAETVSLNERLSNQVYHYDKGLRMITLATDTPNKRLDRIEL